MVDKSNHTEYDNARLRDAEKDIHVITTLLHRVMPNTKTIYPYQLTVVTLLVLYCSILYNSYLY